MELNNIDKQWKIIQTTFELTAFKLPMHKYISTWFKHRNRIYYLLWNIYYNPYGDRCFLVNMRRETITSTWRKSQREIFNSPPEPFTITDQVRVACCSSETLTTNSRSFSRGWAATEIVCCSARGNSQQKTGYLGNNSSLKSNRPRYRFVSKSRRWGIFS